MATRKKTAKRKSAGKRTPAPTAGSTKGFGGKPAGSEADDLELSPGDGSADDLGLDDGPLEDDIPGDGSSPTTRRVYVDLQFRHVDWLIAKADLESTTPEKLLERFVRENCSQDPTKAGKYDPSTVLESESKLRKPNV